MAGFMAGFMARFMAFMAIISVTEAIICIGISD
jgi:hypothetical protein